MSHKTVGRILKDLIKERNNWTGEMILGYPNKEVQDSMYQFLLDDLAGNASRTDTGRTMREIRKAIIDCDFIRLHHILNAILADLPSAVYLNQTEGLYHGLIHILFS